VSPDEVIAMIAKLPPNVQSCSYNATTGEFSVTLLPPPPVEERKKKDEPRKIRDVEMIGRTAPVFGVEE
jgi:hypothetical protein